MNIALTADPMIPVPPLLYGGIERIIDMLVNELNNQGHNVTLFAHKNSKVNCTLIPYKKDGTDAKSAITNTLTINKVLLANKFDIVHSFGRLAYLMPVMPAKIQKLMSYQREPTISQIKKAVKLSRNKTLSFTGCSNYITDKIKPEANAYTIYNCVDTNLYNAAFAITNDAPFVFIGRIEPIKGVHNAIAIALKTKRKLIIAGNIPVEGRTYFDEQIKPFLGDQITYIGEVNDRQKNDLLQNAFALLMPIQWNEPFGIVMIEAMACGTPVLGLNLGAVPEVVINGINGYRANTIDELIELYPDIMSIDRSGVRADCEARFSSKVIAGQYLALYNTLINGGS